MIGEEIETESFRIIQLELGSHNFREDELAVILRIIHASADFDYARILRFSPQAIDAGVNALKNGCNLITDVRMVEVGVSRKKLQGFHSSLYCIIDEEATQELAQSEGITRSTAAMRLLKEKLAGAVVAIGNAPTALFELLRIVQNEHIQPSLVIGLPVGFVNAIESKEALIKSDLEYITSVGRKGGSSIAVACVNALLRLAENG